MQHPLGAFDGGSGSSSLHRRPVDAGFDHQGPDNHLALIYESRDEQFATAIPFVRDGLERGHRCLYVADDNDVSGVVAAMRDAGVDVAAAREDGRLSLHSADDTYLPDGSFDPDDTIAFLDEMVTEAVEEGFDHVRFTGEMTWALDADAGVQDALAEYEAKVNEFYPDAPMTGLCQYSREAFPPSVLDDVLRTHPQIVADGVRCRNVYYAPPDEFLEEGATASTVDRRLRTVRAHRERLTRLEELDDLVRGVVTSAAGAATRDAIDEAVCDHVTDVGSWEYAWVGETNATSDRVTGRATAGDGRAYLDEVTVPATDAAATEPAGRAATARSPRVVDDVEAAAAESEWRRAALERDFGSVVAVPLVYEGVSYGVLSVYGDAPGAFSERAQAVLADVGRAAAFAHNALERRQALLSDRATELALRVPDDDPFVDFVVRADATVDIDGVLPDPGSGEDGSLQVFFTVDGVPEDVDAAAADAGSFSSLSLVAERDGTLTYDGVVDAAGLLGTLLDHAATPESVAPDGERGRAVVRLPPSTDVASFVGMIQDRVPETDLVARREVERDATTRDDFRSDLRDRLTERQWEALRTAYLSGYFEWPRERSGEEVGDRLDVSQPTFNRHLRDSLRKLLTPVFDDGSPDR